LVGEREEKMWRRWSVYLLALSLTVGITAKGKARGPTFTTIDFPGAVASLGTDINDSGQIIGEYTFSGLGDRQGFLLSNGVFTSISFPGATFTRAVGINRFGDIVGDHQKAGNNNGFGNDFGYLFRGGVFTEVIFPYSDLTIPAGINASGDIVGWYLNKVGMHGFLLRGGVYTSIDFPGSAAFTQAWKINDAGEIVGRYVGTSDGKNHMFVLSNGSFTPVADVPGAFETAVVEDGGLNSAGHIVSQYDGTKSCALFTSVGCLHGFLLSGGVYTTIDFPGATETLALGVNTSDQVVGGYEDTSGRFHGYLRTP
jgi:uncharacterized membrane protein